MAAETHLVTVPGSARQQIAALMADPGQWEVTCSSEHGTVILIARRAETRAAKARIDQSTIRGEHGG